MSVHESSDRSFTRWPGLLDLSLGVLLGPVIALVNQQAIYAGTTWVCGHGASAALHIVPALSLVIVIGAALRSLRDWRLSRHVAFDSPAVATRTRFLSMLGVAISMFSGGSSPLSGSPSPCSDHACGRELEFRISNFAGRDIRNSSARIHPCA